MIRPGNLALPAALLAVALFGLGAPLLKWLVERGGHFGAVRVDAISYCNVLFVGNLCSAALVLAYFRPGRVAGPLRGLLRDRPATLLFNTLVANVLAPMLLILALEGAPAVTVVLLLQSDAVLHAVLSRILLGKRVPSRAVAGFLLIGVGVVSVGLLSSSGAPAGAYACTLLAALFRAAGALSARRALDDPAHLPAFLLARNLAGAVVFYGLAIQMFGPGHFRDAFSPGLWWMMLVYAAGVVVLAQMSWYYAISRLTTRTLCGAWTLTPVFGLWFAYLLLGEAPTRPQWIGVALIFAGLAVANLGAPVTRTGGVLNASRDRPSATGA